MFSTFGPFFSKCTFLMLQHFFLPKCQSTQFFQWLFKSKWFTFLTKHLFIPAIVAIMAENVSFLVFMANIVREIDFFNKIMLFINPNHPWYNWSQTDRLLNKNCCKSVSSIPLQRTADCSNGVKILQKLLFWILPTISHEWIDFFSISYFSILLMGS